MQHAQCAKNPGRYGLPKERCSEADLGRMVEHRLLGGTIKHLVDNRLVSCIKNK